MPRSFYTNSRYSNGRVVNSNRSRGMGVPMAGGPLDDDDRPKKCALCPNLLGVATSVVRVAGVGLVHTQCEVELRQKREAEAHAAEQAQADQDATANTDNAGSE